MTAALPREGTIAYFSMDVAVDSNIPTYSGGLGVLAGDVLRSAADLSLPMVALSLLHRKGYFHQRLDSHGNQVESPVTWSPERHLKRLAERVTLSIEGRPVQIGAWQYLFAGVTGHTVPLIFLDADLPENDSSDRSLTDYLYGGDERYRLCQETILGIGGVLMLRALGYQRRPRVPHERGPFGAGDAGAVGRTGRRGALNGGMRRTKSNQCAVNAFSRRIHQCRRAMIGFLLTWSTKCWVARARVR